MEAFALTLMAGLVALGAIAVYLASKQRRRAGTAAAAHAGPKPSLGLRILVATLLLTAILIEGYGLLVSLGGYADSRLPAADAIIIFGVVVLGFQVSYFLYLWVEERFRARRATPSDKGRVPPAVPADEGATASR